MAELQYKLTNDVLFKMMFVQYPELLKRLVAVLLGVRVEDITQFDISNPEMPPLTKDDKHCELDIKMIVNGQVVDLEIQVKDEGDYPERSLFYWALGFASSLPDAGKYAALPRMIVVSIVAFPMFRCAEFHSEFALLEVKRHERLTDRMSLHYFELPKLPKTVGADDHLMYWLLLFKAKTEEELIKIEEKGGPIMAQAIEAYRHVSASNEFKELERIRKLARHNEASALANAERKGIEKGTQEKAIAIAKKMKAEDFDVDIIVRMTGLTVDDILRL